MSESKKIFLSSIIAPHEWGDTQIAPYYLKAYYNQYSILPHSQFSIDIKVFPNKAEVDLIAESILDKNPAIAGFSCYIWNIVKVLKAVRIIKNHQPNLTVVLGGPDVSPRAEEILKKEPAVDIIVRGEGEETFRELADNLLGPKTDLSTIKGISYRCKDGVFSNPSRPLIDDLNKIPSPYLEGLIEVKNCGQCVAMETMRGCYYKCHYCYYHKDFPKIRCFSLERVEKEIRHILTQEPPIVFFMDPTFNANRQRAKKILRLFIKYNRKSGLNVELKAELLDEEMVVLLRKAKTTFIEIGLQSINPRSLKAVNRNFNRDLFKKNIRLLNQQKIRYRIDLIAGLPGDTYSDVKKSLDWVCSLRPPSIVLIRLMILPGSHLREHAKGLGIRYYFLPPYFAYQTDAMAKADFKKIRGLFEAIEILYNSGVFKSFLYVLENNLAIGFSQIFEEWYKWQKKFKPHKEVPDNRLMVARLNDSNFAEVSSGLLKFTKYLLKKHGKPSLYKKILPIFMGDMAKIVKLRRR